MTVIVPLVGFLRRFLACLMLPRDGLAYAWARKIHASRDVLAQARNEIIVGERELMKELRIN